MQQSNAYILIYTVILTIVCGVLLSMTAIGLKEPQQKNIELEKKSNILSVAMKVSEGDDVEKIYKERVKSYVVDVQGKVVEGQKAENIVVVTEYKKPVEQRLLPVYEILNPEGTDLEAYVFPVYGFGLWDNIWGYVALKKDLNTINGVNFDHKAETPGLGARITTEEVRNRFIGKQIFDASASITGVKMMKGEGNDYSTQPNQVDGMSGATITGTGVSKMLLEYMNCYQSFIKSKKSQSATALLITE